MLANELGRRNILAVLFDEKPSTAFNPQANATQARTMEHYRRLGFADEVRSLGLPDEFPTDIAYFTRYASMMSSSQTFSRDGIIAECSLPELMAAIASLESNLPLIQFRTTGQWATFSGEWDAILTVPRSGDRYGDNKLAVLAGPKTTGALIDKFLAFAAALRADRNSKQLSDEYHRLMPRVRTTRPSAFVEALIARANTTDVTLIYGLCELASAHGDTNDRNAILAVDTDAQSALIGILRRWTETVLTSPEAKRRHLNEVSNAVGRFGFRELVPELIRLLDEELVRLATALDGFREAQRRGDIEATSDARMRYNNQYQRAFSLIGGDDVARAVVKYLEHPEFGFEAALVLKSVSDKQLKAPEPDFFRRWPWFDEVAAAHAARTAEPAAQPRIATPIRSGRRPNR